MLDNMDFDCLLSLKAFNSNHKLIKDYDADLVKCMDKEAEQDKGLFSKPLGQRKN